MPRASNLAGQRFGRLVCRERVGSDRHRRTLWRCECKCGGSASSPSVHAADGRRGLAWIAHRGEQRR